ncbi:hypothetical protein D3C78_1554070 [compost metagenome]
MRHAVAGARIDLVGVVGVALERVLRVVERLELHDRLGLLPLEPGHGIDQAGAGHIEDLGLVLDLAALAVAGVGVVDAGHQGQGHDRGKQHRVEQREAGPALTQPAAFPQIEA